MDEQTRTRAKRILRHIGDKSPGYLTFADIACGCYDMKPKDLMAVVVALVEVGLLSEFKIEGTDVIVYR